MTQSILVTTIDATGRHHAYVWTPTLWFQDNGGYREVAWSIEADYCSVRHRERIRLMYVHGLGLVSCAGPPPSAGGWQTAWLATLLKRHPRGLGRA